MSQSHSSSAAYRGPSLLTRVLTAIGATLALVFSFILGTVIFLTALGLLLLLAIGVAIRIWWLRRQFLRQQGDDDESPPGSGGKIIEGDYVVITRRQSRSGSDGQN